MTGALAGHMGLLHRDIGAVDSVELGTWFVRLGP